MPLTLNQTTTSSKLKQTVVHTLHNNFTAVDQF